MSSLKAQLRSFTANIYLSFSWREYLFEIIILQCTRPALIPSLGYCVTLFTGVPGIRKSLFMVYLISILLTDERFTDKCFALEFSRGVYVYFQPTGEEGEFWCSTHEGTRVPSNDFLLLVYLFLLSCKDYYLAAVVYLLEWGTSSSTCRDIRYENDFEGL